MKPSAPRPHLLLSSHPLFTPGMRRCCSVLNNIGHLNKNFRCSERVWLVNGGLGCMLSSSLPHVPLCSCARVGCDHVNRANHITFPIGALFTLAQEVVNFDVPEAQSPAGRSQALLPVRVGRGPEHTLGSLCTHTLSWVSQGAWEGAAWTRACHWPQYRGTRAVYHTPHWRWQSCQSEAGA